MRLDQLTFTRFVAAMVVVQMHLGPVLPVWAQPGWSMFTMAGQTAVTWFYTLSGFILAVVHADLRPGDAISFWWARLARIYPMFVFSLGAHALVSGQTPARDPTDWLLNLSLLHAWSPSHAVTLNLPGWSISVEAAFYAAFPALILLARRWSLRQVWIAAGALWVGSQAVHIATVAALHPAFPQPVFRLLYYWPPAHLNEFVFGIATAVTLRHRRLSRRTATLLLVGGLCAVFVVRRWVEGGLPSPAGYERDDWVGLLAPAFAAIMAGLVSLDLPALRLKPLRLLGEASFAIYLLQLPLATLCARHGVAGPWYFAVLISVGILVHLGFEQPVRRWLREWGRNVRPAAA